jgi:hypothetical protein
LARQTKLSKLASRNGSRKNLRDNNPDKAINVMVVRMLISLDSSWLTAETELLDLESQLKKLVPAEEKKIVRKKKY